MFMKTYLQRFVLRVGMLAPVMGLAPHGVQAQPLDTQDTLLLTAQRDNTIYDNNNNLANGSGNHIIAGRTNQGQLRRALLYFDLDSLRGLVADTGRIRSVVLRLQANKGNGSQSFDLYALTTPWGEGSESANSSPGRGTSARRPSATWRYNYYDTASWSSRGGDFRATSSATLSVSRRSAVTATGNLLDDVKGWTARADSNYGWIMRGDETSNRSTWRFDSREGGTAPQLTIIYETPCTLSSLQAPDTSLALDATGRAMLHGTPFSSGLMSYCNIDTVIFQPDTFTCTDLGAQPVQVTVIDTANQRLIDTITVTINDGRSPTAQSRNPTVFLDRNGRAAVSISQLLTTSGDNCSIISRSATPTDFSCRDLGSNPVTIRIRDASGNQTTATAIVTVRDTTPPRARARDTLLFLDGDGSASLAASLAGTGSVDNCGVTTYRLSRERFGCNEVGRSVVTLEVLDAAGNRDTTSLRLELADTSRPSLRLGDTTAWLDVRGELLLSAALRSRAGDNCGVDSFSIEPGRLTCADTGRQRIQLRATDVYGNLRTGRLTLEVRDTNRYDFAAFDFALQGDTLQAEARDTTLADYRWSFGDGSTAEGVRVGYIYPRDGRYQLQLRAENDNGCLDTAVEDLTVNTVALADMGIPLRAALYPQPSEGAVRLRLEADAAMALDMMLLDAQGRRLMVFKRRQLQAGWQEVVLPTSELREGMYWLRLHTPDGRQAQLPLMRR